jgi:hypothetical protein
MNFLGRFAASEDAHRPLGLGVLEGADHQQLAAGVKFVQPREVRREMRGRLGGDVSPADSYRSTYFISSPS